jgi:Kelch motif
VTSGPSPDDAWSTTDGVNWAPEAANTEMERRSWLYGVVQQAGRVTFIGGVLRSYSNKVFTTTDGDHWTELAPADFSPNILSRGAIFQGAMWVIGGNRLDSLDTNEIWRSADGLTWTRVNPVGPIFAGLDSQRLLVFNNRLWVIGGWDFFLQDGGTETFSNEVWSSADGASWTHHIPSGPIFSPRAGHEAVVFNGRMWVIGGSDGSTRYNDIWSSADGVNWVLEEDHAAFTPRYTHTVVAFNNALWLFAGSDSSNASVSSVGLGDAWRSTDGHTWQPLQSPPFSSRMEQATTVFNGRIYVAAGWSTTDYFTAQRFNDVWSTADGVTWRQETPFAQFSGRNSPILLNHNNQLYLIGGFSVSRTHDVWRSDDGIDWSTAFSHPISPP